MNLKILHLLIALVFVLIAISLTESYRLRAQLVREDSAGQLIYSSLNSPWDVALDDQGTAYVTEKRGRVIVFGEYGKYQSYKVPEVVTAGERGLLGLALSPDFSKNREVYLFQTVRPGENQVIRYRMGDEGLKDMKTIIRNIPAGEKDNGGRLRFGPDGRLYATTGDSEKKQLAQSKDSLAGKIISVNPDGTDLSVFASGFHNPEGITWDSQGNMWATDQGTGGNDEVNLVTRGRDYGWPKIGADYEVPKFISANINWKPSGLAFWRDRLYFGSIGEGALLSLAVENGGLSDMKEEYRGELGLIQAVTVYKDQLYLSTDYSGHNIAKIVDGSVYIVTPVSAINNAAWGG